MTTPHSRTLIAATIVMLAWTGHAIAAEHPCQIGGTVAGKIDNIDSKRQTFQITGSSVVYRLSGLELDPTGSFERSGLKPNQQVKVYSVPGAPDRYGHKPVHVWNTSAGDEARWVQEKLLESGLAIISGNSDGSSAACRHAMEKAERIASNTAKGFWGHKKNWFRADDITRITAMVGQFVVVDGTVSSVGDRTRRLYLNFGDNWSEDFTGVVVKTGRGAFNGNTANLAALRGQKLRLRGHLEFSQGPLIRLIDEAQITTLDR